MEGNIYYLAPRDPSEGHKIFDFDEIRAIVLVARDARQARRMAFEAAGQAQSAQSWLDASKTRVQWVGVARPHIRVGTVILAESHEG